MEDWKLSLRKTIEYWLSPEPSTALRVTRFRYRRQNERVVKVTTSDIDDAAHMYFFRHGDGTWRIFPPNAARPTMRSMSFA